MKEYRPLPEYLTIKQSPIEGLGLFATEDINENSSLGESHIIVHTRKENIIRTPLGGFINHSDSSNCAILNPDQHFRLLHPGSYQMSEIHHEYYLVTLKDIKSGEELTVDYSKSFCGDYYKEFTND